MSVITCQEYQNVLYFGGLVTSFLCRGRGAFMNIFRGATSGEGVGTDRFSILLGSIYSLRRDNDPICLFLVTKLYF